MIKRREKEKKDDRKSTDGKDYVVKKPSSLISKLAKRKQQLSAVQGDITEVTDQEISEIRKRCKAKVSFALFLIHYLFIILYLYSTLKRRKLRKKS